MNEISKRTKQKFYSEKQLIHSHYYKSDKETNILVAGDIHYQPNVDKDIYKLLIKFARETQPDFILLPGDLIETTKFLDISKEKEFFEYIIKSLAEICPVIIVPGNHEIGNFVAKNALIRNYHHNVKAMNYLESLNKNKNVYFLNNEQTKIKDVMFLGFNPSLATYLKRNDEKTNSIFIENYLKSGLKMAETDYNILLTHSSMLLENKDVQNNINDFKRTDLVVSGHWHDAYLPKFLDKYLGKSNAGLFLTPLIAPIPGIWCRGVHDFGRGYVFISQGFRKWTADLFITNCFEKFTANDVEQLIISNPNIVKNSNNLEENIKKLI